MARNLDPDIGPSVGWWRRGFAVAGRPRLFSALFWANCVWLLAIHLPLITPHLPPTLRTSGRLPVLLVLLAVCILLWRVLPWRPDGPRRRASVAFLVFGVLLSMADDTGDSVVVILLALANVTMVFGLWAGVTASAVLAFVVGITVRLVFHGSIADAVAQAIGIPIIAGVAIVFAAAVDEALRARQRAEHLAQDLVEAHRQLRSYANQVHDRAVAEEQTRMARELHDSVGHHLTVIKLSLENAQRYCSNDPQSAWHDVDEAKTLTAHALQEVRRWARAMRSPMLGGVRGSAALRELARMFEGTGVEVEVSVHGEERSLDDAREIVLFRVLQEALTNALRHSGAQHVSVQLGFEKSAVCLTVADDGAGAGKAPAGFGLTSLAERVREVGGVLRTAEAHDEGLTLSLRLPQPS